MSETPAIYADLAKVMRSVGSVGKGDFNQHQKFNFRGIDGVLNAVGPALREHQVVVVPELIGDPVYEEVQTSGGKKSTACRVKVAYLFYSAKDGSKVSATVAAESWDTGDKAMPKAMSVAFRTALIQALALPTDEPDPDSFTYTREAAEEQYKYIAGQVESTDSIDELRELYTKADKATRERITQKVKRIQEGGNNG